MRLQALADDCISISYCRIHTIQGGAFRSGSASLPMYHGDVLARKHEVVAVSINYRIGALGGGLHFPLFVCFYFLLLLLR